MDVVFFGEFDDLALCFVVEMGTCGIHGVVKDDHLGVRADEVAKFVDVEGPVFGWIETNVGDGAAYVDWFFD